MLSWRLWLLFIEVGHQTLISAGSAPSLISEHLRLRKIVDMLSIIVS